MIVIALARSNSSCKLQAHPFIRENTPTLRNLQLSDRTVIKMWSQAPDESPTPRQAVLLSVGHNITSTVGQTAVVAHLLSKGHNLLYRAWTDRVCVWIYIYI
jgi:hypothetical protein